MSRSRVGSLGRRLSYWLALQSLAGLVVICAAVYGGHASSACKTARPRRWHRSGPSCSICSSKPHAMAIRGR